MNIRLIVPNCNRSNSPCVAYGPSIARIAGGFTATQGTGGWIDGDGSLIVEPVTVFDCYHDNTEWDRIRRSFDLLARQIARDLNQTSVYLGINGEVEFIGQ